MEIKGVKRKIDNVAVEIDNVADEIKDTNRKLAAAFTTWAKKPLYKKLE